MAKSMWSAILLGTLAAAMAFIVAVVLDAALVRGVVLRGVPDGANVGWDPVSYWRQSDLGKLLIITMIALPLLAPVLSFAITVTRLRRTG